MTTDGQGVLEPGGFFGTYRVVRPLEKGGMGWVYLVDGPEAGTQYALKILDPKVASRNEEFVRRFIREAEFSMNVRNANLVEVYDAGQDDESGLCYLTMEYMAGGSLRRLLDAEGALSVAGAHAIARDIAHALRFVEENGLVHRDVKPDNVLFTADGRAKLTDLGITLFRDEGADDASRTMAGRVVGTVGYMAPEQMMDAHAVDIRADIYSLGVILYEMLAGERPNARESAISSLAKAIRGNTLPDIRERRSDVPERFAQLIADMTSPDADLRPATAAYLVELLEDPELLVLPPPAEEPQTERVPTATPVAAATEAIRNAPLAPALVAVFVALLALLAVVITILLRR